MIFRPGRRRSFYNKAVFENREIAASGLEIIKKTSKTGTERENFQKN
jgi:hypothetical protein